MSDEDQIEDLTMYAEQWSNMNDDNVYMHRTRNAPNINNTDILQNHQQFLLSHQPHHTDITYPSGVHFPNTDVDSMESATSLSTNGNSFNPGVYERANPNFNMNYAPMDLSNGQAPSEMYKGTFNALNMNKFEVFARDMEQYNQQHYPMTYSSMNHMASNQQNTREGLPYSPEHMMSPPPRHTTLSSPSTSNNDPTPTAAKSQLIDHFLGNWTSSPSGTYTPFGHTFLNVQPNLLLQKEIVTPNARAKNLPAPDKLITSVESEPVIQNELFQKKDSDNISFSGVGGKKRIVAEVKPMRPSYSAVLSKTPRMSNTPEINKKKDIANKEFAKPNNNVKLSGNKQEKFKNPFVTNEKSLTDEKTKKSDMEKKSFLFAQNNQSGEINLESSNKNNNKNKSKNENVGRKYISLDDLMNDDDAQLLEEKPGYNNCDSEFVFLTQPEDKVSSRKKNNKKTDGWKHRNANKRQDVDTSANEGGCEEVQDSNTESDKLKRKSKENKCNSNARKILAEKNKKNSQGRNKKIKNNGYLGKMQRIMDGWIVVMKNIIIWFYNLLSDIFRMSAQLSVDFASVSCRNTYMWMSDICTSIKEKATSPQWLKDLVGYIDKKMGHTWVGFWRNIKFLNFLKYDDDKNSQKQSNINIPLPATGDEAMKRLLACKGKDPYSILGVGAQCSDDDIKRYYRRQAFLVHPDKNQQPGAEEAFKILQHAFDLIGVPARREAYDRKLVESAQMEAALSEVAELLAQLQDKVKHAAGTIRCTNCCRRHVRTITTRPAYAARYCQQCNIRHAAKEGDIWAESHLWGLLWKYYACMDGAVYQITQWASCQKKNLKHLVANTHHVQYRIVLGNNKTPPNTSTTTGTKQNPSSNSHDTNLEDFLNNLYSKTGQTPGDTRNVNTATATSTGEANKNRRKTKKNKS